MPFFKKFKDRFTKPDALTTLRLNKNSFSLGENVGGVLTATSNEEFDCKEIRLEIQCEEKKKRNVCEYDSMAKRQMLKEVQDSATLWSAKPTLSGPLQITKGFSQTFPINVNIPAGGRPTFVGTDDNVSWTMKGVSQSKGDLT
jgi:hypothetical protein